ncbi:hypothetical protein [Hydrogenimonas sp.]
MGYLIDARSSLDIAFVYAPETTVEGKLRGLFYDSVETRHSETSFTLQYNYYRY